MLSWSQQLDSLDAARRRVYALAALVAAGVQAGVAVLDVRTANWADLPSTVMGTLLALGVLLAVTRGRVPLDRVNRALALLAAPAVLADVYPAVHHAEMAPHQYLSFILLTALWFGLLPLRTAAALSAGAYVGFAAVVLTRPVYDPGLLTYLACVMTVVGLTASFGQQVTAHRHDAAAFQHAALTDTLTGLPNRRALLEHLQAVWADSAASGGTVSFALLMIDLDHFKAINDQHTHTVGDQVLRAVGPALRALTGPADALARWGGEEFMLLLPDTTARGAYATAARLDGAALVLPSPLPSVTFSAGAALSHEAPSVEALLALVDQRLHAAKDAGRSQVRWDARAVSGADGAAFH